MVIGPFYKDAEGFTKVNYEPRPIPERLWQNAEHRRDLIQAGVMLYDDLNKPPLEDNPKKGRPTNEAKALKEALERIAKLEAEVAAKATEVPEVVSKSTKPSTDAGKA